MIYRPIVDHVQLSVWDKIPYLIDLQGNWSQMKNDI